MIKDGYLAKQFIDNDFCERLPIEKGYIRLAIVEEEGQRSKEKDNLNKPSTETTSDKSAQTFTDKRLSSFEDIYGTKTPIEPKDIFKKSHSAAKPIRRALILGRAGIGKSTLCHYVAYQWAKGNLWKDDFMLVLWIPLRRLLHYPADKANLFEMVLNECIPDDEFGTKPYKNAHEIESLLRSLSTKGKILYVCDGLDEVKHLAMEERGKETPQGKLIRLLLNQSDVMMTSRPYYIDSYLNSTVHSKGIDQRLENIGFLDKDVDAYIQHFFAEPAFTEIGKRLITFFNQKRTVKGIAHIPINLSLICNAWKHHHNDIKNMPMHLTMTDLYVGLMTDLGIRYLANQCYQPKPRHSLPNNILQHSRCQPILGFLAELAFEQMQKPDLIILPETINAIRKKYRDDILEEALKFGLLKDLEKSSFEDRKSYYFVHLTFQEFLAAYHIAERLKQNDAALDVFIQQHKYHPEYEITWWFLAGLLKENACALQRFFDVLEDAPSRDLIGLTHQCLILRCLDECALQLEQKRLQRLLIALMQWIRLEMRYCNRHQDNLIVSHLRLSQTVFKQTLIQRFFSDLLQDIDGYIKRAAAEVLGQQWTVLSETVQDKLVALLRDPEAVIRETAARALGQQWVDLPEAVQTQLVELLKDSDGDVRWALIYQLSLQWANLPEAVQTKLVALLKDFKFWAAAEAPGRQWEKLPAAAQTKLVALLQNPAWYVREAVAEAFEQPSAIPAAVQGQQLGGLLQASDAGVKIAAARTLGQQSALSEAMQDQLVALLKDPKWQVRRAAAEALEQQSALSKRVLTQLIALLEDPEWRVHVKEAAAWILKKQSALSTVIQAQLVALLLNSDEYVRMAAAKALGQQSNLSENIIQQLVNFSEKIPETTVALQQISYHQIVNLMNFKELYKKEHLLLFKILLKKSLQQRLPIYFVGNQFYVEKIACDNFTEEQKTLFIKTTQQILAELMPHFSEMTPFQTITNVLEENEPVSESKPWCGLM